MNVVGKFEKVSFDQFLKDMEETFGYHVWVNTSNSENVDGFHTIYDIYENLQLPKRSTNGSAGYDFHSPISFELNPGNTIKIPTGIKARIDENWVLFILPRSSVGFKYRVRLDNVTGVIDSDYYNSENNEGHIFIKITNEGNKTFACHEGDAIVQGIFLQYGITEDDDVNTVRTGGIGSTGK